MTSDYYQSPHFAVPNYWNTGYTNSPYPAVNNTVYYTIKCKRCKRYLGSEMIVDPDVLCEKCSDEYRNSTKRKKEYPD